MARDRSWLQVLVVVLVVAAGCISILAVRSRAADDGIVRQPAMAPGMAPGGMPGMPGMMPMMPGMPMMPMMNAPTQMVASGSYVYVLRGDTLYQYSASSLKLVNQATLPAPKPPQGMPPGGMMPGMPGQPPADQ